MAILGVATVALLSLGRDGEDAGDDRGADGAEAYQQDSERARSGRYLNRFHGELDYIRP